MKDKGEGLDIIVDRDGNFTVEAVGTVGPECEALTAVVAEALGSTTKKTKKPEYHQRPPRTRKVTA